MHHVSDKEELKYSVQFQSCWYQNSCPIMACSYTTTGPLLASGSEALWIFLHCYNMQIWTGFRDSLPKNLIRPPSKTPPYSCCCSYCVTLSSALYSSALDDNIAEHSYWMEWNYAKQPISTTTTATATAPSTIIMAAAVRPPPIFVLPVFWKVEPRVKKPQAILINLDSVQKPTA